MKYETKSGRKVRHTCRICGSKKYERFMRKVNEWHQGQWECVARWKCERDKNANYRD